MCESSYVHIINVEKRQTIIKRFIKISEALSFVKSYPKCKGCFIYAVRYNEVLAIKSDLAPLKIFDRNPDYYFDSHLFDYDDYYRILFEFTSTFSVSRF